MGRSSSADKSSLRRIYLRALGALIASFTVLLSVALINNFHARRAISQITLLEQQILFPLGRAVEDTYSALMELKQQTLRLEASSIVADYFNSELSNAKANLDVAMNSIASLSGSVELLVPISETIQLVEEFEEVGSAAISARKLSLEAKEQLFQELTQVIEKIQEIQTEISQRLLSIKTNAPERTFHFQALNDLTAIRNSLVEIQSCIEHTLSSLEARPQKGSGCMDHMSDIEFLLESAAAALPEKESELKAVEAPLARIERLRGQLEQFVADTKDKASAAASLADELSLNLELCRQSVSTINDQINRRTNSTLKNLFFILLGAVLLYVLVAFTSMRWLKRQLIDPLVSLSMSVKDVGRGNARLKMPQTSIRELDLLGSQLRLMSNRLRLREKKIKEARRQWEAIFKAIGGPAFILDEDLRIQECNNIFLKVTGYGQLADVKGRKCMEVVCNRPPVECDCPLYTTDLDEFNEPIGFENRIGDTPYYFTASPCHDAEGRLEKIVIIGADLSGIRALEHKLQRAQKMEALGTLAGGVAHDLNNILTGIVTYPDMLLMQLPKDSPLAKPLQVIKTAGERAAAVVQDLLTLARRTMDVKDVVNLNEIITEYLASPEASRLRSENPALIIETDLDPNLMNVEGSPVHLIKMIMNLVTNSAEAISGAGRIRLTTRNIFLDRPISGYDNVEKGEYVKLTVEDDGSGISPEDLPHIFEPFYSKKAMGMSGSGLGMAVVWGTVKDHKGYIDVTSAPGKGTRFDIYLPVSRRRLEAPAEESDLSELAGDESILVVDDVAQQRQIASDILGRLGYQVTVAAGGEEAVALCQKRCFDLVVLDMIMEPGMDGLDTYQAILESCPGQRAILTSGYSETERVRRALELGVYTYLRKPFTLKQLAAAVRACLDTRKAPPSYVSTS